MFRLLPLLLLAACRPGPALPVAAPADFALVYDWNTGSLPPPYYRSETIRIEADGAGRLEVRRGSGGDRSEEWSFRLDEAARQQLYASLQEAGLGIDWEEEGQPPVGGASWSVRVTAGGGTVTVPAFVAPAQQGAKERVGTLVRALVPASVTAARDAWLEGAGEEAP